MRRSLKSYGLPGVASYAMLFLWLLLTVLATRSAHAAEAAALTASDILPAIEAALIEKGAPIDATITLAEPMAPLALLPGVETAVEHASYNPSTGRFIVHAGGVAIGGIARTNARYPVLLSDVPRGAIIAESDIGWIDTTETRAGAITSADDLIGMEARRALPANALLRQSDIVAPVLVKRGSLVTMTYAAAGLALSETAVAQATGSRGDVIEVKNPKSDRVLRGVVDGKNRVRILSSRVAQVED